MVLPPPVLPTEPLIAEQPGEPCESLLRKAERARLENETSRAHLIYARAVAMNPNDPRGWIGLATTAPNLDEAIISWAYALALNPADNATRIELNARLERRIERSGPPDAAVLVALGRLLAEVGQRRGALLLLARATELDPKNEEAWIWRAGVTEDNDETIACLTQVLKLNPVNPQAHAGLEWARARKPMPPQVVSLANTQQAATIFEQALTALRSGSLERAHALFSRATELDCQDMSAWVYRASTAPDTGEAIICMERAHVINPNDETVKDSLWWLHVKKMRESAHIRKPTRAGAVSRSSLPIQPQAGKASHRGLVIAAVALAALAILVIGTAAAVYLVLR
jgi:tetratricopeptide (TPR) repeat protein